MEQATQAITAQYPEKLIIITLGKDGAIYHFNGKSQVVAGKAKPVDTTGAGDAFVSGLLAGLAQTPRWHDETVLVEVIHQSKCFRCVSHPQQKGAMSALPNKAS